jgi:5-methyltetrahydropteroyltriglutamate--homocysteine methyltransferase
LKRSIGRILTSHAGSLPRPPDLLAMNQARQRGEAYDADARAARLRSAVGEVVAQQAAAGIDIVNDGEYSKINFLQYPQERLTGFEVVPGGPGFFARRDWQQFEDFYRAEIRMGTGGTLTCVGPVAYVGQELLKADIDNFTAGLKGVQVEEAFMTAIAPGTFARGRNTHYATDEEYHFAIAEAMREEYRAIVEAGFVLQIDDPGLPDTWDQFNPEPTLEEYRKYARMTIEALNHGLQGLPEDRIRYHICWGSWHGPHTTDIPLRDIVDLLLEVRAGCYSLEAGNPRHAHDWKVWRDVKLPDGKLLMPGVVSHASNVVEHPELVADRIEQYAALVGRENVIAGTDCGMGGRIHTQIAWAKFEALAEGARIASQRLWH